MQTSVTNLKNVIIVLHKFHHVLSRHIIMVTPQLPFLGEILSLI